MCKGIAHVGFLPETGLDIYRLFTSAELSVLYAAENVSLVSQDNIAVAAEAGEQEPLSRLLLDRNIDQV
ncbi:MAG: hypothetical protein LUI39_05535 [Lachnospiraceae bacterium]|nr:hypothetical protein [Lachnospiraceae bacterium]